MADRSGPTDAFIAVEAMVATIDQVMKEINKMSTDLQKHRRELFFSMNKLKLAMDRE